MTMMGVIMHMYGERDDGCVRACPMCYAVLVV